MVVLGISGVGEGLAVVVCNGYL